MRLFAILAVAVLASGCSADATDPTAVDPGSSEDELRWPAAQADCHRVTPSNARGAYFRKVISGASARYAAIHVSGVLPSVRIDENRWFTTAQANGEFWKAGPLDRPSVYLGGRASEVEVDAGLSWDRVYDDENRPTWTDVAGSRSDGRDPAHRFTIAADGTVKSATGVTRPQKLEGLKENFAFRPYWRVSRPSNAWENPPPGTPTNVYFYPGEEFRMQIRTAGENKLRMNIGGAGGRAFEITFDALGWGVGANQTWKRVHSIDQFTVRDGKRVGLETLKSDVLPTNARLVDMTWTEVSLLDIHGAEVGFLDCSAEAVRGSEALFASSYAKVLPVYGQNARGAEGGRTLPPTR